MNLSALLRQFSIRTRMIGAIGVVLVLLLVVGSVGLFGMSSMRGHTQDFLDSSMARANLITRLVDAMGDVRRHEKDMIINYEKPEVIKDKRQQWEASRKGAVDLVGELGKLGSEADKAALTQIVSALDAYAAQASKVVNQLEAGGYDHAAVADKLLEPAKAQVREAEKLIVEARKRLEQESEQTRQSVASTQNGVFWTFVAMLGFAAIVVIPLTLLNMQSICRPLAEAEALAAAIAGGDLSRPTGAIEGKDEASQLLRSLHRMQEALQAMVGQLRSAADSIRTASVEIATGNQDLSSRTEQTASNLQQAASSLVQLTGTVKQTADSARTANQLATSASGAAAKGGEVVSQVVSTMDEINASSKRIGDIIGVIDGIAFQTNILALNAAVEAARAGEQGRGFAVVAGEVRSLAQRSAEAAREIKTLIGASVERVETGSRLVQDAGATMGEIVSSVQRVTDIIGEITAASAEQSDGISQVNQGVSNLDQMTQQNAALVEQSAAAAESLKDQAERLGSVVDRFRVNAHQQPAAPAPRPLATSAGPAAKPAASAPVRAPLKPQATVASAAKAKPQHKPLAAATKSPEPQIQAKPATTVEADGDWETF
jgi:methyl-accepting chemotaxis protein